MPYLSDRLPVDVEGVLGSEASVLDHLECDRSEHLVLSGTALVVVSLGTTELVTTTETGTSSTIVGVIAAAGGEETWVVVSEL